MPSLALSNLMLSGYHVPTSLRFSDAAFESPERKGSPAQALAKLLSDASITNLKVLKQHTEAEVRYFLYRGALPLQELPRVYVQQHYFPRELVEVLVKNLPLNIPNLEITSARTRKIVANGVPSYFLDLKGPKKDHHGHKISRAEVPFSISEEAFHRLGKFADAGSLEKTRYLVKGTVDSPGKRSLVHYLEIDELTAAGGDKINPLHHHWVTADLELHDLSLLPGVMRGGHSFEFLENFAIPLSNCEEEVQRHFSNKRIAKRGITPEVDACARHLLKRIKKAQK